MKKVEYRFGLMLLMIAFITFGCPNPTNDTSLSNTGKDNEDEIEIIDVGGTENESDNEEEKSNPEIIDIDEIDNESENEENHNYPEITDKDDKDNESENEENHNYPEITDFSFNVNQTVIRSSYAVRGTIVGSIDDVTGGTPPFAYQLINGNGSNDVDNQCFIIEGDNVIINEAKLSNKTYCIYLEVSDINNMVYSKTVSITIYPGPITKEQDIRDVNGISFAMRYISSGTFNYIEYSNFTGIPAEITISNGFWMAETEVTQELFQSVMGYNPSIHKNNLIPGENSNRRPVENISFLEAIFFCNRLSILEGKELFYQCDLIDDWLLFPNECINDIYYNSIIRSGTANGYRLPSEYEWKWAFIGADVGGYNSDGYKKIYSGGPVSSGVGVENYAWFFDNSEMTTHEVMKKLPNEVGIYDMTGNVDEYVNDYLHFGHTAFSPLITKALQSRYYHEQSPTSPIGFRVVSNR
jgi:hypothetical protein